MAWQVGDQVRIKSGHKPRFVALNIHYHIFTVLAPSEAVVGYGSESFYNGKPILLRPNGFVYGTTWVGEFDLEAYDGTIGGYAPGDLVAGRNGKVYRVISPETARLHVGAALVRRYRPRATAVWVSSRTRDDKVRVSCFNADYLTRPAHCGSCENGYVGDSNDYLCESCRTKL